MTFLIILGAVAAVYCIALLFRAAVYALPIFCGLAVGLAMQRAGWSCPAAFGAGFLTGSLLFALARACARSSPSTPLRATIALIFAGPAAAAGYQAGHGVAGLWLADGAALQSLAASTALVTAVSAARAVLTQHRRVISPARPPA